MDVDDSKQPLGESKYRRDPVQTDKLSEDTKGLSGFCRQLLARIEEALWVMTLDASPGAIYVNPAFCRIWGMSTLDIGQQWTNSILPEDKDAALQAYDAFLIQDAQFCFEYRIVRPDGKIRWIAARADKLEIGEEQLVLNIARDITEQKLAQLQYQTISQSAQDSIFCKDLDRKYTFVNLAMAALLQRPAAEILGKTPEEIFSAQEALMIAEVDARNLAGETVDAVRDLRIGDEIVTLHTVQVPLRDEKLEIHGISGIVRNISEQKRMAEQLQQIQKMEAIGQLAGGIAHDLNNQLQGMMGYAGLLYDELEDYSLREDTEKILQAARHCAELTKQLLAFARKGSHISTVVNIHDIINNIILLLNHTIDKRVSIDMFLQADLATVNGDPDQLQNALLNLGFNANEAMPQGGRIIFSTALVLLDESYCQKYAQQVPVGPYVRIGVSDTGIGMTREIQSRIFEPFFTTKNAQNRLGMGLAAVYGIIKSHGGIIRVSSEIGHGTTFDIYLPATKSAVMAKKKKTPAVVKKSTRILLVDDEEIVRDVGSKMLDKLGYQVVCHADGLQGVDYYREHWPNIDLVIIDMIMPGFSGNDTFVAIRAINPDARILLASGYSLGNETEEMLERGLRGFIPKPFRLDKLAEMIAEALS